MESGEGDTGGMVESHTQDSRVPEEQLSDVNDHYKNGSKGNLPENSVSHNSQGSDDSHDQLLQMVVELRFQNEFLKSQFEGFSNISSVDSDSSQNNRVGVLEDGESDVMNELQERIQSLNKELEEEKQTRHASEEALTHLQTVYSETETKAQELSKKLAEAQTKLDQQTKEHEDKYSELDLKFNRLHKRAKQRIQEIQKEKDDLEARFNMVNETADRASAQQSALQQELERTRKQANEALKAMDGDRQQLRSANNKLRDDIEDLQRSLQPKESALEALQLSLTEKEQMLKDMKGLLQDADEKKQASLAELSAKHRKNIESLEAQLNDAFSDRSKATESISSLQVLVAEKESKIAEMEAASTGEAARLRAAMESVKGDISHLKQEHEKERERWETASQALKAKLEIAEGNCIRAEVEVAKIRSQLESEVSAQASILSMRDAELLAAKEEVSSLEREFSSYKVRAHALLQKKDADLAAAKDSEQIKALEEALKEAENEISSTTEEKDRLLQDLQSAMANHEKELAERDTGLENATQRIRSLETRLDSANAQHLTEKEAWGLSLQNVEETWRIRCEAMKAENEATTAQGNQKELEELKQRYKKLKEEHASFHDLADRTIEEKDNEISRLLDDNKNLRQSLQSRSQVNHNAWHKWDSTNLSPSAAEQQILILARQQAQREEELARSQRHILALQEEIEELEHENRLHSQQEAILKTELRNMERANKREGVDMTYLKNVILKLLETGEVEVLLPVIGMLLQFSPEEMQKCQQAYQNSTDVPPTPASDASGSSGLSLFSRFSFS
ncbi:PREDICTED: protein GRIP-like isoform X2 [Lupinus angustifolius]|uniref:protein GRIP-like isoform X2 n=1 Tax=Lupinus angustifolius TaxID=3871 RepID=UPI00092E9644|nr:PREDICTED: protein GRIP-like isoform X2 [Lupinus angustifolius]